MATAGRKPDLNNTVRVPFVGYPQNRLASGDKDQRFLNCFVESKKVEQTQSTKNFLIKRAGLVEVTAKSPSIAGAARGLVQFNGHIYSAIGGSLYKDNSATPVLTLTGTSGIVAMHVCDSATIGKYLFVADGTSGWYITAADVVTQISNTSVGRVTITATGTGYTSAPTVAFSAPPSGTTATGTAEISGGGVIGITITNRGSGYASAPTISFSGGGGSSAAAVAELNAFPTPHEKTITFMDGYVFLTDGDFIYNSDLDDPSLWLSTDFIGSEQFPDSCNALARQNNQLVGIGDSSTEFFYNAANATASPLARTDAGVIQFGTSGRYAVLQTEKFLVFPTQSESGGRAVWLIDGYQPKKVSDENIERILNAETSMDSSTGYGIRSMGHFFYVLNLVGSNRTLVYDIEEKLWHEWSTWNGTTHNKFEYSHMADDETGEALLLHNTSGKVFRFAQSTYQDNASAICVDIITSKLDLDSMNRKFIPKTTIVGEQQAGLSVDIRWTDDDYTTWSNWYTIDMSDDRPTQVRQGAFRRRAYQVRHTGNTSLRLDAIEFEVAKGEH